MQARPIRRYDPFGVSRRRGRFVLYSYQIPLGLPLAEEANAGAVA